MKICLVLKSGDEYEGESLLKNESIICLRVTESGKSLVKAIHWSKIENVFRLHGSERHKVRISNYKRVRE